MDINRLRQFRTIVESGSMSAAAELLAISKSGLSRSMEVLAGELGVELFAAQGRGLVVTDAGREIYQNSEKVLEAVDGLLGQGNDMAPQLRIGTFEVFSTYFLGDAASNELVELSWSHRELVPGEMEEALSAHQIDVGITYEPIPRDGVEHLLIRPVTMDIHTASDAFDETPFEELPFAVPMTPLSGTPTGAKGLDGWLDDQRRRRIEYRVTMMETALDLARRGLCAVFIPCFVADLHNHHASKHAQLVRRKYRNQRSHPRSVYLVKRIGSEETPVIKKLAKALRRVCY